MKRLVAGLVALYLCFALVGRVLERLGAVRCGCSPDCWCRRPGLSTFRWALPYWHRSAAHDHDHDHEHAALERDSDPLS